MYRRCTVLLAVIFAAACVMVLSPSPARAQACGGVPPNMLIVQDISGSMDEYISGWSGPTKWDAAVDAVKKVTDKYANGGIRFGLELFADPDQSGNCTAKKIHVGVADNNAAAIQNKMNSESPWSNTPLREALDTANGYSGLKDATRPNYVLLVTDGQETCDSDTSSCVQSVKNLRANNIKTFVVGFGSGVDAGVLNQLAVEGGTAKPQQPYYYQADNQADLEAALDAIAAIVAAGPCTVPGQKGECAIGEKECVNQQVVCKQKNFPSAEVCDGKDNDCDGTVDNGIAPRACSTNCGSGTETCSAGQWVNCTAQKPNACGTCTDKRPCSTACGSGEETCTGGLWLNCTAPKPQNEVCDGKDNDCDKQVDENDPGGGGACTVPGEKGECAKGTMHCQSGVLKCVSNKGPVAEICDGFDNNCDGAIDENLERPCSNKCGTGVETCAAGKWDNCTVKQPTPEQCNGQDDDCDGVADNGDPGGGQGCTPQGGMGACGVGTTKCVGGKIECVANQNPKPEECNGLDDDCDGNIDNGDPGSGLPCASGKPGICAVGHSKCQGGKIECIPDKQPEAEVCDGIDNNCDGRVDEGVRNACGLCGDVPKEECDGKDEDCNGKVDDGAVCDDPAKTCINGECVGRCSANECPQGLVCKDEAGAYYCLSPCNGVTCDPPEKCDENSGQCYDPCATVKCESGKRCQDGDCVAVDCHESGCAEGMVCVGGDCERDPCATANCPAGSACDKGECVPSCAAVACPIGERCIEGECQADPCSYVGCPDGKHCENGSCVDDPCAQKECGKGYICVEADCVDDPCLTVTCPDGQECRGGECFFDNTPEEDGGFLDPDGGGETDGGGGGPDVGYPAGDDTGLPGDYDGGEGGGAKPNLAGDEEPPSCSCATIGL
jgi:hypothetical protein